MDLKKDAIRIAESFGTPTFVLYEETLRDNYRRFSDAFTKEYEKTKVGYSVKTNNLPSILNILYSEGADIEVVSGFELYLALKLDVSPERIIYNGPSKTRDELEVAIEKKVFLINADSDSELRKIDDLGRKYGRKVLAGLRVNIGTLGWTKFGIPIERAEETFTRAAKLENIDLKSIHIHLGTDIGNPQSYTWALDRLLSLMGRLRDNGLDIEILDIGGGFPANGIGKWTGRDKLIDSLIVRGKRTKLNKLIELTAALKRNKPVFRNAPPIETYAREIASTLRQNLKRYGLPEPLLILEPGRAVVSSSMALLVKVIDIKGSEDRLVMVDGGTNLAPSLWNEVHRMMNVSAGGTELETVKVAGPLCMDHDLVCRKTEIARVSEGDIIAVSDVGAYSLSRSTQFIRPRGATVLVKKDGRVVEIRRREGNEDLLNLDTVTSGGESRNPA